MIKFIFILSLVAKNLMAFNIAQITVLEAPLFREPDDKSKIVQYLQKGEKIPLHPAEIFKDPYKSDINLDEKLAENELQNIKKNEKDPLFQNIEPYQPDRNSKFFKTSDNLGNDAWILKEHVFVLYEDQRELDQKIIKPDPTDYVLEEPLPKGYPLFKESGYRSYLSYGFGPNTRESYPYKAVVRDQGYGLSKALEFTWAKFVEWDEQRRVFFGLQIMFHTSENQYFFESGKSTETLDKLSVGPRLEYDVWRNDNYRFNINTTLQFSVINEIKIKIQSKDSSLSNDERTFSSFEITPVIGANFQKKRAVGDMDFLAGFNVYFHPTRSFSTTDKASEDQWWNSSKYDVPFYSNINLFLAMQVAI